VQAAGAEAQSLLSSFPWVLVHHLLQQHYPRLLLAHHHLLHHFLQLKKRDVTFSLDFSPLYV